MDEGIIPDFTDIHHLDDIKDRFYRSAKAIMLGHDIVRGDYRGQITALELYLFHPKIWQDESTDTNNLQLERAKWYVRTNRFAKQWRIDITAGSVNEENEKVYAGLLIAAIGKTDGSGNALKKLLHGEERKGDWSYSSASSPEFEFIKDKIHGRPVYSDPPSLRLEKRSEWLPGALQCGRRKGLDKLQWLENRYKGAELRIAVSPPCEEWKSTKELKMIPI